MPQCILHVQSHPDSTTRFLLTGSRPAQKPPVNFRGAGADLAADAQADALEQLQGVQGVEGLVGEAHEGADVQEVQPAKGLKMDQGALL